MIHRATRNGDQHLPARQEFGLTHRTVAGSVHMDEILNRLQYLQFSDARMVGAEIHVTTHRVPVIVAVRSDGRYVVHDVAGHSVARVCDLPDEVVNALQNWR